MAIPTYNGGQFLYNGQYYVPQIHTPGMPGLVDEGGVLHYQPGTEMDIPWVGYVDGPFGNLTLTGAMVGGNTPVVDNPGIDLSTWMDQLDGWNGKFYTSATPFATAQRSATEDQDTGNFLTNSLKAFASGPGIPLAGFALAGGLSGLGGAASGAAEGTSAGALSGTTAGGTGVWDYGDFLKSIGIDPSSTAFSGGTMSNADILSQIYGGGSLMPPADLSGIDPNMVETWTENWNPNVSSTWYENFLRDPSSAIKALLGGIGGSGGNNDLLSILGKLGAAGLGAYGANQQAQATRDLAQKYMEFGAPSRARFEASMSPGFDPLSIPGYSGALDTASKAILAKLSATGGNPYGSPGALIDANKAIVSGTALPAIQEYQRTNLNAGGLGNMNAAVPNLEASAIGQQGNAYNAFGYGLNQLTNPTQPQLSAQDIARAFGLPGLT